MWNLGTGCLSPSIKCEEGRWPSEPLKAGNEGQHFLLLLTFYPKNHSLYWCCITWAYVISLPMQYTMVREVLRSQPRALACGLEGVGFGEGGGADWSLQSTNWCLQWAWLLAHSRLTHLSRRLCRDPSLITLHQPMWYLPVRYTNPECILLHSSGVTWSFSPLPVQNLCFHCIAETEK